MIIVTVNPRSALPGTRVAISGSGFGNEPSVFFGNVVAETDRWDDTGLICFVPDLPPGIYALTVTDGNQNDSDQFTVLGDQEPTIDEVSPQSGPVGTQVTIIGSGFSTSSSFDSLQVLLDDVEIDSTEVLSDSELQFTIPDDATSGDISIVTASGEVDSDIEFSVDSETVAATHDSSNTGPSTTSNPVQIAIAAAWNALFQPGPGNLPATLVANNPIVEVADIDGLVATQQQCDACWDPQDPYMNAAGNATVDLDGMWLQGLSTLASGGEPAFTASGDGVSFPVTLGTLSIGGTWTLSQECASFGNDSSVVQTGGLNATVAAANYWLDAAVTVDRQTQLAQVTISEMSSVLPPGVEFVFSYDDGLPKWLMYLTGEWVAEQQLGDIVADAFTSAFADSILPQISLLINAEVAALTEGARS
jgi:hypothetical protein